MYFIRKGIAMKTFSFKRGFLAAATCIMMGTTALAATPADTYKEAVNNMINNPQGEYTMQIQAKMPFVGEGTCTAAFDVQADPFVSQVKFSAAAMGQSSPTVNGYIEQSGKKMIYYYDGTYAKLDNKKSSKPTWVKNTVDLKSAEPIAKQIAGTHHVLSGVKDVTVHGDSYVVTYDMSKLYTAGDEKKWAQYGAADRDIKIVKEILQALQEAGDVKANVAIDPSTKRITKIEIPLTEHIRSIATAIFKNDPAPLKEREELLRFITMSEVSLSIECTALPNGMVLTVPDDVRKNAKEYK